MSLTMEVTQNLAPYLFLPPVLRRPEATTLTLPACTLRPAVPAVYGWKPVEEVVKKLFKRGRHRMSWRMRLALALMGGTW